MVAVATIISQVMKFDATRCGAQVVCVNAASRRSIDRLSTSPELEMLRVVLLGHDSIGTNSTPRSVA